MVVERHSEKDTEVLLGISELKRMGEERRNRLQS